MGNLPNAQEYQPDRGRGIGVSSFSSGNQAGIELEGHLGVHAGTRVTDPAVELEAPKFANESSSPPYEPSGSEVQVRSVESWYEMSTPGPGSVQPAGVQPAVPAPAR